MPWRSVPQPGASGLDSGSGVFPRRPIRYTLPAGCASAASGAARRPPAITPRKVRRSIPGLLNHLIRPLQERRRDRQPEGLGDLEVDHQLELGGLLDGPVAWLRALLDLFPFAAPPPHQLT